MKYKFIKLLQQAHAGELAAYYAYQGHWESLSNPLERDMVKYIQKEELDHIHQTETMLYLMGAEPSTTRDLIFTVIGKTFSKLCKITGRFLPMYGALLIEKIGVSNYNEMARLACKLSLFPFVTMLQDMEQTEKEHEEYFLAAVQGKQGNLTNKIE